MKPIVTLEMAKTFRNVPDENNLETPNESRDDGLKTHL